MRLKRDRLMFPTPPGVYEVRTICRFDASPHRRRILREFYPEEQKDKAKARAAQLQRAWSHCRTRLIIGGGRTTRRRG